MTCTAEVEHLDNEANYDVQTQVFDKQRDWDNYQRLLKMLPVVLVVSLVMVANAFILDDTIAMKAIMTGFTAMVALELTAVRLWLPQEIGCLGVRHRLLVDVWCVTLLLWGTSVLGYAPNAPISYFDFVISVLVVGVACLIPWRKLVLFYLGTILYLLVGTPFLLRVEGSPVLMIVSLILFIAFGLFLGRQNYEQAVEHHRLVSELCVHQSHLHGLVLEGVKSLRSAEARISGEAVTVLAAVLEQYDSYTKGHSENVARTAEAIGRRLGYSPTAQKELYWAGMLHDIGKTRISSQILNKLGPLSPEEYGLIREHPRSGFEMISVSSALRPLGETILYHHERWDGTGYPEGLAGDEIPAGAQIMALADSWDAMRSRRSYREPLSLQQSRAELQRCRGTQFSPRLVDLFLTMPQSRQTPVVHDPNDDCLRAAQGT